MAQYTDCVEYEWDVDKDRRNRAKHGVSFAEAATAFLDPLHATVPDDRYSVEERRFRTIGYTASNRLVIVAHTDRGERVRIISAREATAREQRNYEQ
ncbi:MAG TPA: BrnT family toxin [Pyrinomonadaceae bacterium]|nr:BrnT family toxin [Pyrinomonadaceae bacterium]